jgi:hypothetical protein
VNECKPLIPGTCCIAAADLATGFTDITNLVCNGERCNPAATDGEEGFIKVDGLADDLEVLSEVACLCCSGNIRRVVLNVNEVFTVVCVQGSGSTCKRADL